jgi:hypothetical protein
MIEDIIILLSVVEDIVYDPTARNRKGPGRTPSNDALNRAEMKRADQEYKAWLEAENRG